jgi:hypothetical protein
VAWGFLRLKTLVRGLMRFDLVRSSLKDLISLLDDNLKSIIIYLHFDNVIVWPVGSKKQQIGSQMILSIAFLTASPQCVGLSKAENVSV